MQYICQFLIFSFVSVNLLAADTKILVQDKPIFPDSFFDYKSSNQNLNDIFNLLQQDLLDAKNHKKFIDNILNSDDKDSAIMRLSKYILNEEYMQSLKDDIKLSITIRSYQIFRKVEDIDIALMAIDILNAILHNTRSIRYLAPILTRFEHSIALSIGDEQAQHRALAFLINYVINRILSPHFVTFPCSIKTAALLKRILKNSSAPNKEEHEKDCLSREAHSLFSLVSHALVKKPVISLDSYFVYLLEQHLSELDIRTHLKTSVQEHIIKWLKASWNIPDTLLSVIAEAALERFLDSAYGLKVSDNPKKIMGKAMKFRPPLTEIFK